jgi:hypothetical protein
LEVDYGDVVPGCYDCVSDLFRFRRAREEEDDATSVVVKQEADASGDEDD